MTTELPDPSAVLRVAELYAAGMFERALQEADVALTQSPDDATLHTLRAQILCELDRPDLAIPSAQYAIALEPEYGTAHRVLAEALLQQPGGSKKAPLEPALAAVRLDPSPASYYVLTYAWSVRHKYREARRTAEAMGNEYPGSIYVPLAHAVAEMGRAGALHAPDWKWVVIAAVVSRGLALVVLVLYWGFITVRGIPHLRRADAYLRAALQMSPTAALPRLLVIEVFRRRFRFATAVDVEVSTGALDARLIDADGLVTSIARRTTTAIVIAAILWFVAIAFLGAPSTTDAVLSAVTSGTLGAGVTWFRLSQARSLTPALRLALSRKVRPMVALVCVAAVLLLPVDGYLDDGNNAGLAVVGAGLAVIAVALLCLIVAFFRSRRV